jgi:hypothetical protein
MRSYKKMNDRTLNMTVKKGGAVVVYGLITVSPDGKSQDVRLTSPDAITDVYDEKTKPKKDGWRNRVVYDKE